MTNGTPAKPGFNPYAGPKAQVDDVPAAVVGEPVLFPVSPLKLALMSLVTFGLYEVYWFYKNWKCVERLEDVKVIPILRAIFYPLFAYSLFRRVREQAAKTGAGVSVQAGLLAIVVFVLAALWRLPDPYWLVTFLGFVPLLAVQSAVNAINGKVAPDADPNSRFRPWNIFGLVVGGILFVFALIGAFLGE